MRDVESNGPAYPMQSDFGREDVGISKLLWLAAHAPWEHDDQTFSQDARPRFKWAQAMLAEHARLTEGE